MMTKQEYRTLVLHSLGDLYDERETALMGRYLVEDLLGKDVPFPLTGEHLDLVLKGVRRLAKGEPLQYVTNKSYFYGYEFYVDHNVLIPRPETEELVHHAIRLIKKDPSITSVLEIGSGSGCIPICIKKAYDELIVRSIDVSPEALIVAQKNKKDLTAEVEFSVFDFLDEERWTKLGQADLLISNPPYIATEEMSKMHSNVLDHEPHIALFSHGNANLFYEKMADFAIQYKVPYVLAELNEYNSEEVYNYYISVGFAKVNVIKDLQGKDRILHAEL